MYESLNWIARCFLTNSALLWLFGIFARAELWLLYSVDHWRDEEQKRDSWLAYGLVSLRQQLDWVLQKVRRIFQLVPCFWATTCLETYHYSKLGFQCRKSEEIAHATVDISNCYWCQPTSAAQYLSRRTERDFRESGTPEYQPGRVYLSRVTRITIQLRTQTPWKIERPHQRSLSQD